VRAEPRRGTFGRLPAVTRILAVTMAIAAALGGYEVTVTREFFDYREAETGARLAVPGDGGREGTG